MTRIEKLVQAVLEEGGFDAEESTVLQWLTWRQRSMCSRSRCYRKKVELGVTVAGQTNYAVPAEVRTVEELDVNGVRWGKGRHEDIADGAQGHIWLSGGIALSGPYGSGVAMRDDSSSGQEEISLYPAPTESGHPIVAWAVCSPPDLVKGDDTTLVIPDTMEEALVNGAVASGMIRLEARPDLAQTFEAIFNAGCEELAREQARRFRGSGPAQIRVVGVNA